MSDCDIQTSELQSVEQALEFLLHRAGQLEDLQKLPLADALGRVLAEPVSSPVDVPPWNNSAMDGYAVNTADLPEPGTSLPISQRIPAGSAAQPLAPQTAARIFTGAPVPEGADAVVIQEVCRQEGGRVVVLEPPAAGANIRLAGEDISKGALILPVGARLLPQHLGLAASVGIASLTVYRKLRVAVFSSGDELVMPGSDLGPGQIYNSNHFTLGGLLQALGCEIIQLGTVEDTFEATCEALQRGAEQADLIVASGGVSVGEEDHVKPAVEKLGSLDLWKIALRPGKPLAFGYIGETPFIGTPGNPVSLFVTFCLFARPFIMRMQGMESGYLPDPNYVVAGFSKAKADKRREYMRARLVTDTEGRQSVQIYPSRSSGALSSVAWADGLVVVPENKSVAVGDIVTFYPFSEFLG